MSRAELLASLRDADHGPVGPTVLAVHCPEGHPTSAYDSACRVCGSPVDTSSPVTIPRPVLGYLVLPSGESVTLDRDVVLGRAPKAPPVVAAERPNLVKISDPGVSRTHVLVSLRDWQVLVRDLGSSNGTEVVLPGRESVRLREGQDMPLLPGSDVVLGEDIVILHYRVTE
jgi:pSer/pThr/pTyr-binding forkhead associated (FHA) protein